MKKGGLILHCSRANMWLEKQGNIAPCATAVRFSP